MCKQKCLFYIAKYYFPFELVFDKDYFLPERPLGFAVFRFYRSPRVAYFKLTSRSTDFSKGAMGCDTLSTMNRRMRSRMSGGVGIGRR